jgi:hypothetical protein
VGPIYWVLGPNCRKEIAIEFAESGIALQGPISGTHRAPFPIRVLGPLLIFGWDCIFILAEGPACGGPSLAARPSPGRPPRYAPDPPGHHIFPNENQRANAAQPYGRDQARPNADQTHQRARCPAGFASGRGLANKCLIVPQSEPEYSGLSSISRPPAPCSKHCKFASYRTGEAASVSAASLPSSGAIALKRVRQG